MKYAVAPPPSMIGGEEHFAMKERANPNFSQGKEPPPPPPKTDYADIGLKLGSGFGGLMSLISFIEKIMKWFRRDKKATSKISIE